MWGPYIASKHLSTKGETLYRGFKNVLKKKPLSSKSRGFQQKTWKTGVHGDFSMDFEHFRAMDSMLQKTIFSLDFTCGGHGVNRFLTISMPWFPCCKSDFFIGVHMWMMPWCEKRNSRPPSHAGTRSPWRRFLEIMHAFQDSVPVFIQNWFWHQTCVYVILVQDVLIFLM